MKQKTWTNIMKPGKVNESNRCRAPIAMGLASRTLKHPGGLRCQGLSRFLKVWQGVAKCAKVF